MTIQEYYRYGVQRALSGQIDLDGVDLGLSLYTTLGAAGLDVETSDEFADIVEVALTTINIPVADRSWSYDGTTRVLTLKTANVLSYTPVGAESVRYAVLHVNTGVKDLIALYDFETAIDLAAGVAEEFDIRNLLEFRLYSASQPAPLLTDATPVSDASPDGTVWRILTDGTGALITAATNEDTPAGLTYLTAPDASKWALSVDDAGAVTAVAGTPGGSDTVYAAGELRLPSTDPGELYVVDVDNAGAISTTLVS